MNNGFSQLAEQFIPVTGDEAVLTDAYNKMMDRISNQPENGLHVAIVCPETEADRQLASSYLELRKTYKQRYGLQFLPTLVPVMPQPVFQQQPGRFYPCQRNELTDLGMARELMHRRHLRVRNGSVYLYNGQFYRKLNNDQLKSLILDVLREELEVDGSSRQLASVAAAVIAEPGIEVRDENIPTRGLCLQNCVIDLDSMTCGNHSPTYFFTIQLQVSFMGPLPTPVMDRFVYQIAGGDPVLIQRIWEMIGYCLNPQDNRAKRFIVFQGPGNTGKSVLGSLLASFYSDDAVGSVDAFKIGDRFALSALVSKALNISMDLPNSALNDQSVGVLKQITGNDLVQVEEKYKTPYAARINCKMIFGTNHQIRTNSFDAAFLRRVLLIPFANPIPKHQQDTCLLDKLKQEKSGIFYKAIGAYSQLAANNYMFSGDEVFDLLNVKQTGEQVIDQDTLIEQFIERHVVVFPGGFVPTETLHMAYLQEVPGGIENRQRFSSIFNKIILQKGIPAKNDKSRVGGQGPFNGYKGIMLR